jgi:hypothetical protein
MLCDPHSIEVAHVLAHAALDAFAGINDMGLFALTADAALRTFFGAQGTAGAGFGVD